MGWRGYRRRTKLKSARKGGGGEDESEFCRRSHLVSIQMGSTFNFYAILILCRCSRAATVMWVQLLLLLRPITALVVPTSVRRKQETELVDWEGSLRTAAVAASLGGAVWDKWSNLESPKSIFLSTPSPMLTSRAIVCYSLSHSFHLGHLTNSLLAFKSTNVCW